MNDDLAGAERLSLIQENVALRARVAELEGALVDCVIELTELVSPEYGPLVRARAVLAHSSAGK